MHNKEAKKKAESIFASLLKHNSKDCVFKFSGIRFSVPITFSDIHIANP